MEPKVIELLFKKVREATKETQTLYDLSEAETILMSNIICELPLGGLSMKLAARLLRAAAHFIERNHDISEEMFKLMKE